MGWALKAFAVVQEFQPFKDQCNSSSLGPSPTDMHPTSSSVLRSAIKSFLLPALWLLVLPAAGLIIAEFGTRETDQLILREVERRIDADAALSAADKAAEKAFSVANPPSAVCTSSDPALARYRDNVCSPGDDLWQFLWASRASLATLILGALAIIGALVLGLLASWAPSLQVSVFVTGWVGLTLLTAFEVVVQAVLATWLSYWVTALFMHVYILKLIFLIGGVAVFGAWVALRGIFQRVRLNDAVEGELISEQASPALFARLRELASRVGTQAPAAVVGGLDDNFFVTEAGLTVAGRRVDGRALFVSLPLLRVLSASEADAVLAHELAHFRAGDTASGARLGPLLVRADLYLAALGSNVFTRPAFFVMQLFRTVFDVAAQRQKRGRELEADRVAAQLTSADDLARSLLKIVAYSSHRQSTEQRLFEHAEKHEGLLSLRARIAAGLSAHVATAHFREVVAQGEVPHPFDSHPPLVERLKNVGSRLSLDDCERLVNEGPGVTWADQFGAAAEIEDRLWAAYEARFSSDHELSLACRSAPSSDEERALIEKHFPPRTFTDKSGTELRLSWAGLQIGDRALLSFGEIFAANVFAGSLSTTLVLTHTDDSPAGPGPTEVNLGALGDAAQADFTQTFARYRERHQLAAQWQAAHAVDQAKESTPAT